MLSRLHRTAEALDGACLRAWGHPDDPAIRDELLSILAWDSSLHPEHAQPAIRSRFAEVHENSVDLSNRLRAAADHPDGAVSLIQQTIQGLRQSLAALMDVLASRPGAGAR